MRLPRTRYAVAIFALLLVVASVYRQYWMRGGLTIWPTEAFAVAQMLLPVSLFIAAFVIDNRWALILPLAGFVGETLVNHLVDLHRGGELAQAFEQVHLRTELWHALTNEVVTGTIIAAAALLLAARWWPLSDDPAVTEYTIPEVRIPAIVFAACFFAHFAYKVIFIDFVHAAIWPYGQHQLSELLTQATTISFFVLVVCAYSLWVLPIPIFMTGASVITILLQPGFSCDQGCKSYLWPQIKYGLIVLVVFMLIAFAAGRWTRSLPQRDPAPLSNG